ncbi:hypothetical protein DFS34DRAFT_695262 [Phlyctochytrium arcticum]|nr:hypothetical protein DFS34DRAFT_695262 [Phlyctochytrium arcticum]
MADILAEYDIKSRRRTSLELPRTHPTQGFGTAPNDDDSEGDIDRRTQVPASVVYHNDGDLDAVSAAVPAAHLFPSSFNPLPPAPRCRLSCDERRIQVPAGVLYRYGRYLNAAPVVHLLPPSCQSTPPAARYRSSYEPRQRSSFTDATSYGLSDAEPVPVMYGFGPPGPTITEPVPLMVVDDETCAEPIEPMEEDIVDPMVGIDFNSEMSADGGSMSDSDPDVPEEDAMDVDVPADMMDVDGNPPCVWQDTVNPPAPMVVVEHRVASPVVPPAVPFVFVRPALPLPAGTVEVKGKAEALANSKLSVFEDDSDDDNEDGRLQSTVATKKSRPAVTATVPSVGSSTIQRLKPLPMRKFRNPQGRSGR